MTAAAMVLLLWLAAGYRLLLSARAEKTVWRTAFTVGAVGVALGATLSEYGDRTVDPVLHAPNLSSLLTHLTLIVSAASASIYVVTLRQQVVPARAIFWRIVVALIVTAIEICSWVLAPVHARSLADFSSISDNAAACVFNVAFVLAIVLGAAETARFCLTRAASRDDPTRTISLALTGSACLAGAVVFAIGGVAVIIRFMTGSDVSVLMAIFNTSTPFVMAVLAMGTLSLLLAPPTIEFVRHYRLWRSLKPLWSDLIETSPEVHLDVPITGGPRRRVNLLAQRAIVEVHDALRLTSVAVASDASLEELGQALHSRGVGHTAAADVLGRAATSDEDIEQLLHLARSYRRSYT